jgi:large subunit ribosomal protein L15
MQIHQIQPKTKNRKAKRVGRGGKRGTYSGRGMKGQGSRAGTRFQPRVRELFKRYPKLRGYQRRAYTDATSLNVSVLEAAFQTGETVSPKTLVEKSIIARIGGRPPRCKILGRGELAKKLTVEHCMVSASARAKIEKAGGIVKG